MAKGLRVDFTDNLTSGLENYFKKAGISRSGTNGADKAAKTKVGLQLLNWVVNGSPKEPVVPPIYWGVLRSSGSAFVGSEFVGGTNFLPVISPGQVVLNKILREKPNTITIGFNTAYATRMHETNWMPGERSLQSGDVGNKFVEKHLKSDKEDLMAFYAVIFKKETGG